MLKFILKRVGYMFLTLWIIATITFMLMHTIPGSPLASLGRKLPAATVANYNAKYGFDRPVFEQYKLFIKHIVMEGNLGESIFYPGRTVEKIIKDGLPISARVGVQAVIFGFVLGVTLGIVAAFKRGRWPDYLVMFIALLGISVPSFVYASILQYFFTVKWEIFPTSGWGHGLNLIRYSFLPSLALSFAPIATYARYMRNNCLDVINQDYILTAKAKGVSQLALTWKHIIRNAILPSITILGPEIAVILTGSFVIENIFALPGLGNSFISAVTNKDYTMIMGLTIFVAFLYIVSLLVVDILYGLIDPRIRITGEKR